MKIGVLSDTHSREWPRQLIDDLKTVDLIVHVGDFSALEDYKRLTKINDVRAVFGNMDDARLRAQLPKKDIFQCGDLRIGLYHGDGPPERILERVQREFKGENVQAVIFGHSHEPLNVRQDGVLYFNPGSPTDEIFAPYRSYGIIEVQGDKIEGKIIRVEG